MKKEFNFSGEFGEIDDELVKSAGREWEGQKHYILRLYSRKIACAVIIVALGFAMASNSRVQAAVKEVITMIGQMWGVQSDLSPYTEVINQSQKKEGFNVMLKEVILSDNRLYTAVTATSDSEEGYIEGTGYVTINGKDYVISETFDQSGDNDHEFGKFSPNHIYTMTFEKNIPEEITEMILHYQAYRNDEDLLNRENTISFDFAFSTTRGELEKNKISIPLDIVIPMENGSSMALSQMVLTALDSRIEAKIAVGENHTSEYYLEGTDSMGNLVLYIGSTMDGKEGFVFESNPQLGLLPSLNSKWIELQLFTYQKVNRDEWEAVDKVDGEDIVIEDDGNPINKVYLGDKFKIRIK